MMMRRNVFGVLASVLIAAGCSSFPHSAAQAPPPTPAALAETVPPQPGTAYVWVPGAYTWQPASRSYVWVPGHWTVPPKGHVWIPGHWETRAEGNVWVDGAWRVN
jgi:hypothetical protein